MHIPHSSHIITIHRAHNMVSEHQKQSNRKMSFWLHSHSLFPLLLHEFQVPRKAVFYHQQENKKPLNPPKQVRQKPTKPTSPSQLPALLSSALPDSPWEKVTSPPPHQPQCSLWHASLHAHQDKLSSILCCSHQESNEMFAKIQPHWEMLWFQFIVPFMIWFQSEVRFKPFHLTLFYNRYIFAKYFFSSIF